MRTRVAIFAWSCMAFLPSLLVAQTPVDAARYFQPGLGTVGSNLNTSGGFSLLSYDYESVLFNPAMSSLFANSEFSMSLNTINAGSTSTYLGNSSDFSENAFGINALAGVFKLPTYQGNFALSAGYIQKANYNRVFSASGFNTQNSVSDFLAQTTDDNLRFISYNGYAIDSARVNGVATGEMSSIYRFSGFTGINQYIEQTESGQLGEFVVNASTEVIKDIFIGFTLGIPLGTYSYERVYFEQDVDNNYDQFPSNVTDLLYTETFDARVSGIYAKLGTVIKPAQWLNIGISYQTPYELEVNENYFNSVFTRFDDGTTPTNDFIYQLDGSFTYTIMNPQIIQVGLGIQNLAGLDAGLTLDYRSFNDLEFSAGPEFKSFELTQNRAIRAQFRDVLFVSGGVGYDFNGFKPQAGFAYIPSMYQNGGVNLMQYSLGFLSRISDQMSFSFGMNYQTAQETVSLYQTADFGGSPILENDQYRLSAQIGLHIRF